ncbi:hypothetical protein DMENIID0001_111730 [Sergentomyia squamirostris]
MENSSTTDDLQRVVHDEDADVTFVFPNDGGAMALAKKSKLIDANQVFEKQFTSGLESDPITVTDISFATFNSLIRHIYEIDEVVVNSENCMDILYCSRKYFLDRLTMKVIEFINTVTVWRLSETTHQMVKTPDLLKYYVEFEKFDIKLLNEVITNRICHCDPIYIIKEMNLRSEAHMKLLKIILDSSVLNCSEYDLYQAVIEMMKKTKGDLRWDQVKKKFGHLIYLIRFPMMTVDQLVKCRKQPCFLTSSEIVDLQLWKQERTFTESLLQFSIIPRININMKVLEKCCEGYGFQCKKCKSEKRCDFSDILNNLRNHN